MFPQRFYPGRMYADRYWAKVGAAPPAQVGPTRFASTALCDLVDARRSTAYCDLVDARRSTAYCDLVDPLSSTAEPD
jgi:hypothetical protein